MDGTMCPRLLWCLFVVVIIFLLYSKGWNSSFCFFTPDDVNAFVCIVQSFHGLDFIHKRAVWVLSMVTYCLYICICMVGYVCALKHVSLRVYMFVCDSDVNVFESLSLHCFLMFRTLLRALWSINVLSSPLRWHFKSVTQQWKVKKLLTKEQDLF